MTEQLAGERPMRAAGLWYMVTLLSLAVIVSYLDRGVIAVLVPYLKRDFGISDVAISLLQGYAFSIPFAFASLPVGRMVDFLNRRNVILSGILIWSCSTISCGLATSYWQLFAARAGIGIGEACLLPAAYSMVADSFRSEKRGRAMSILTGATGLGGGSAALAGGALLTIWGAGEYADLPLFGQVATWRAVFIAAGTPGFVVALFLLPVREPRRHVPTAQKAQASDFAGHIARNWRLFTPLYIGGCAMFFSAYAVTVWGPATLARVYGLAPGTAGMLAGAMSLAGSLTGNALAGLLGDRMVARNARYGRLRVWALGLVPSIAAGLLLAGPTVRFFEIGIAVAIFASGILTAVSYPALYDVLPTSMRGRSLAFYMFLANIVGFGGGALGVALITSKVFGDEMKVNYSVALAVGGAALILVLMTFIMRKRYEEARLVHLHENADTV